VCALVSTHRRADTSPWLRCVQVALTAADSGDAPAKGAQASRAAKLRVLKEQAAAAMNDEYERTHAKMESLKETAQQVADELRQLRKQLDAKKLSDGDYQKRRQELLRQRKHLRDTHSIGTYTFRHLSFQEALAADAVASRGQPLWINLKASELLDENADGVITAEEFEAATGLDASVYDLNGDRTFSKLELAAALGDMAKSAQAKKIGSLNPLEDPFAYHPRRIVSFVNDPYHVTACRIGGGFLGTALARGHAEWSFVDTRSLNVRSLLWLLDGNTVRSRRLTATVTFGAPRRVTLAPIPLAARGRAYASHARDGRSTHRTSHTRAVAGGHVPQLVCVQRGCGCVRAARGCSRRALRHPHAQPQAERSGRGGDDGHWRLIALL
jgi:hypothetical protein